MGDDGVYSVANHINNMTGGIFNKLKLLFGSVAEGVTTQCDDYAWAFAFLIWHRCRLSLR